MKVKYVGFGGYMEVPCYEDENGKLYFDENNGKNGLNLYTGAYRTEWDEICGEPCNRVTEPVECDDPFVRHPRERDYMFLDRMRNDCNYFLGNGNGYEGHLWAGSPTASGAYPVSGRTVAMADLPFGTKVEINGQIYTVEDRGVPSGCVDIYVGSHSEALNSGMYYAEVRVVG